MSLSYEERIDLIRIFRYFNTEVFGHSRKMLYLCIIKIQQIIVYELMFKILQNYGTDKFFDTGVYYNELPEDIKSKINNGFGFETESELYDFLESYSS